MNTILKTEKLCKNFKIGESCGIHIEQGPQGGIVALDDTTILDMALQMIEEKQAQYNT